MRTGGASRAFLHACGAVCALCAVPVSMRGPPPQRYLRAKCAVPHCARTAPQSLDCVRVRSLPGPVHFASLRSAAGAVGRAVGTGARRFSARLHSATANPPSSAMGNPSAATARLAWSRCLPAPIASVPAASCPSRRRIRSGPVAGTPRPLRAIGTCPLLRCAFRAPYYEQGECAAP